VNAWLHDGTLEGFLCALSAACGEDAPPDDLAPAAGGPASLFAAEVRVGTDADLAASFLETFRERAGGDAARRVVHAYLSERRDLARPLWEYVRLGRRLGPEVESYHANAAVSLVRLVSRRVTGEAHRLNGLLRFRRLADGVFWAPCEPVFRVAGLVAFHFRRRMADAEWVIHDVRRGYAVRWDRRTLSEVDAAALAGEWPAGEGAGPGAPAPEPGEARYEELWRAFFRNIAIPARRNAKRQRRFMPRRYWKYLVEKTA